MAGNYQEHIPKLNWYSLRLSKTYQLIIWISVCTVLIISIFDLAGWIFNLTFLNRLKTLWGSMRIITALCMILSAVSLLIINSVLPKVFRKTIPKIFSTFIFLVSFLTIYCNLYYFATGQELFPIKGTLLTFFTSPELRMAFLTSINFIFVGCVIFLLSTDKKSASGIAHGLIIPVVFISYFAAVSYMLGIYTDTELKSIPVTLNTCFAFFCLSAVVILLKPDTWLMKVFTFNNAGGLIAKRLIPAAVIVPVVIAWLRIRGEHTGLFESEEGVVLVAVTYAISFLTLAWFTARSLNKLEKKKLTSERALLESEVRFKIMAESLPVGMGVVRIADGAFLYVNPAYEQYFGYSKDELLGKKTPEIYYDLRDRDLILKKIQEDKFVSNFEVKLKRKDGSSFWSISSSKPIIFNNSPALLGTFIDITEQKRAQEELIRLNHTLNAHSKSSHYMMHSNNELNYLKEVCKIIIEDCGHTMVWIGFAQNDERKSVKPVAYYGFDKGYIDQMDITWDDTERGMGPTGTAIRTGKPTMCKNMQTDPAFKPWKESALKRGFASSLVLPLNSEGKTFGSISIYSKEPDPFTDSEINLLSVLADDLAYGISFIRLTESERAAAQVIKENEAKLKELIATKDKFFNIVAHDLKNPFTSLLGSSELLYENINQMTTENIRKLALILNDSAKGGYSILLNLLDWSRSQTGLLRINPEKINLKDLIDENISNLELSAANKEINLIYESPEDVYLFADKNMVNTILRNILSNALKFTHKNGSVKVSTNIETENINIFIKDTGIGISQDRIDKLFNLETKNSTPGTEMEQGTGLGLKLSKEFVEKHGGKIFVESVVGKGSIFQITLPKEIKIDAL
jgi:PAS domain S-box-containing protein